LGCCLNVLLGAVGEVAGVIVAGHIGEVWNSNVAGNVVIRVYVVSKMTDKDLKYDRRWKVKSYLGSTSVVA